MGGSVVLVIYRLLASFFLPKHWQHRVGQRVLVSSQQTRSVPVGQILQILVSRLWSGLVSDWSRSSTGPGSDVLGSVVVVVVVVFWPGQFCYETK